MPCENCGATFEKEEAKKCTGCSTAKYCNEKCQSADWSKHRLYCIPSDFGVIPPAPLESVEKFTEYGNSYLKAKVELSESSIIFTDKPVVAYLAIDSGAIQTDDDTLDPAFGENIKSKKRCGSGLDCPSFCKTSHERLVYLACAKAPWICNIGAMRTEWKEKMVDTKFFTSYPYFKVTQSFVDSVVKEIKEKKKFDLTPLQVFRIAYFCSVSFVDVHSMFRNMGIVRGIYNFAWLLNFSCEPNCTTLWSGGEIHVVALRRIAPGEELNIAIAPLLVLQNRRYRDLVLYKQYGIKICVCDRCRFENGPIAIERSIREGVLQSEEVEKETKVLTGDKALYASALRRTALTEINQIEETIENMDSQFMEWVSEACKVAAELSHMPPVANPNEDVTRQRLIVQRYLDELHKWKPHGKLFGVDNKKLIYALCSFLPTYEWFSMFANSEQIEDFRDVINEMVGGFRLVIEDAIKVKADEMAKEVRTLKEEVDPAKEVVKDGNAPVELSDGMSMIRIASGFPYKYTMFMLSYLWEVIRFWNGQKFVMTVDDYKMLTSAYMETKKVMSRLFGGRLKELILYDVRLKGYALKEWQSLWKYFELNDEPCPGVTLMDARREGERECC